MPETVNKSDISNALDSDWQLHLPIGGLPTSSAGYMCGHVQPEDYRLLLIWDLYLLVVVLILDGFFRSMSQMKAYNFLTPEK